MKKSIATVFTICLFINILAAQDNKIPMADDLDVVYTNTFISKENLTRLFKASAESGFFGNENGTYSLDASLFGLKALLNPNVEIDKEYLNKTNRILRRIELSFKLGIDDENTINSFSPGIQYGIIDKRDAADGTLRGLFQKTEELLRVQNEVFVNAVENYSKRNTDEFKKIVLKIRETPDDDPLPIDLFDPELQQLVLAEMIKKMPKLQRIGIDTSKVNFSNLGEHISKQWEKEKESISRKSLLTLGILPEFMDNATQSLNFELRYLKGLNVKAVDKTATNLEIFAEYRLSNDTLEVENNINERISWTLGANLGKVLIRDNNNDSFLEFKSGIEFAKVHSGLRQDEESEAFNLNFELIPRIGKDMYIPLILKYDPENANVFGAFNLTWNFSGK